MVSHGGHLVSCSQFVFNLRMHVHVYLCLLKGPKIRQLLHMAGAYEWVLETSPA